MKVLIQGLTEQDIEPSPSCQLCLKEVIADDILSPHWIEFPDGSTRYYCGECPGSDFESLVKLARKLKTEVAGYEPGYFALEMEFEEVEPGEENMTWLISSHNVQDAIERAENNDPDHEIVGVTKTRMGQWVPKLIRRPTDEELEEAAAL